jgi:hypothetical protein
VKPEDHYRVHNSPPFLPIPEPRKFSSHPCIIFSSFHLILSSYLHLSLPSGLFLSCFSTKSRFSPIGTRCFAHLILLGSYRPKNWWNKKFRGVSLSFSSILLLVFPLRPKYLLHHPTVEHAEPVSFPWRGKACFTKKKKKAKLHFSRFWYLCS